MGVIEKIKSSVEMWRIEKYTKRRPVTSPDFEQKGMYRKELIEKENWSSKANLLAH